MCDIPIGRDDTGRSAVWVLYREWLYRRKIGRNSGQILQKLEQNDRFFMNEAFHRPNQIKIVPIDAEKSSDSGSGLKKIHLQAKWRVMKNPDFSKRGDFFHIFSYLSK